MVRCLKKEEASTGTAVNLERTVQLLCLSLENEKAAREGVTAGKSLAKDTNLLTGKMLPVENFIKTLKF